MYLSLAVTFQLDRTSNRFTGKKVSTSSVDEMLLWALLPKTCFWYSYHPSRKSSLLAIARVKCTPGARICKMLTQSQPGSTLLRDASDATNGPFIRCMIGLITSEDTIYIPVPYASFRTRHVRLSELGRTLNHTTTVLLLSLIHI